MTLSGGLAGKPSSLFFFIRLLFVHFDFYNYLCCGDIANYVISFYHGKKDCY